MSWPIDDHQHFVKVSEGPELAAERRAEGQILRYVAHPGVVRLLAEGPGDGIGWELTLHRVDGGTLAEQPPWSPEEVAGFGAALATTVADLHDLGVVHGQLTDDHVLIDPLGRPVICGFGHAKRLSPEGAVSHAQARDVADLARMIGARLGNAAPRQLRKLLDRACDPETRRPVSARQLAAALGDCVPGCRLPETAVPAPELTSVERAPVGFTQGKPERAELTERVGSPKRRAVAIGLGACVTLLVGIVVAFHRPASPTPSAHSSLQCPEVDLGCRPLDDARGIVVTSTGRYRLGGRGDVLVLGRWTCQDRALPAELELRSGRVWIFQTWATAGHPTTARLVATVRGARSLAVRPERSGCDQLAVIRRRGPNVIALTPR